MLRGLIAGVAAVLVAAQCVRNAAVLALSPAEPAAAARAWSGHPATEISLALTEIALAARDGRPAPPTAFALSRDAAGKDPLAPEPFLVRGVQAQLAGSGAVAQRAFEEAQWRDPRSLPAAYFLADRYFRTGQAGKGLKQVAALARLTPNGVVTLGPFIAAFASDPANWPALRSTLQANPSLREPVIAALASNIASVPAALALADLSPGSRGAPWVQPLLTTLANAGQFEKARSIWLKLNGLPPAAAAPIHDLSFADDKSSPPFNWALTSSSVGLAERQGGGRLHILFYGNDGGILASQLLLLPAGSYRLSMKLAGTSGSHGTLNWSLWCGQAPAPLSSVTLESAASEGWRFRIPADCPAQWLKLSGTAAEPPEQSDVTISALQLQRTGDGG